MSETDKVEFSDLMQHFMPYLVSSHSEFASYFRTYYLKQVDEWVTRHRVGTLINTNMHLEAFQHYYVLKYVYQSNRRVDHLIQCHMKYLEISALNVFRNALKVRPLIVA